jgi:hypothetical protein
LYYTTVNDTSQQSNKQLGLLDLSVDLSVPEVYSGTEFTLYLHVKNPFSRAVWIKSVELSLPTQLSAQDPNGRIKKGQGFNDSGKEFTRKIIRERESEIERLRNSILVDGRNDSEREKAQVRLNELEDRTRADLASLSGALVVEPSERSRVVMNRPRGTNIIVRASGDSRVVINEYTRLSEAERVPLVSSLPPGAALQPGSTDVWTIRLGSRRTPFFVPAKFKLQLTVIYGLESPPSDEQVYDDSDEQVHDSGDLYSNTCSFTVQVRAALWSVILGGVAGGVTGSIARSLQGAGGAVAFSDPHANSTIGAIVLAAILSGAAVVFSARKSDTQSFVTVEDFWGGVLVGFLIGYSGTAAFAKIAGTQA